MRLTRSLFIKTALLGAIAAAGLLAWQPLHAAEEAVVIPPPAQDQPAGDGLETAVVAGGCFWGVQGVYQHTAGVVSAVSGYAGGTKATADYRTVSSGTTGHAESVQI
ncbi:MAG: peptide-methionine (S)-S-oxide reductase, partial [Bradyrhizobium sp.]|nr:peptide-methionine (S)-S-oxide reductase [Bradyrhizobium sp.]